MTAQEMNGWIITRWTSLWEEVYASSVWFPLPQEIPVSKWGWFTKNNSVADLKGLKMRIPGLGGEVFKRIGGCQSVPGNEPSPIQMGLSTPRWFAPYNDLAFGLHKAAKYYYHPVGMSLVQPWSHRQRGLREPPLTYKPLCGSPHGMPIRTCLTSIRRATPRLWKSW